MNNNQAEMKMTRSQLKQEWQDILDLANHNKELARWLDARDVAFKAGDDTSGYTNAIRLKYRAIMLGNYDQAA